MRCPVDGTTLVLAERAGVEIDYCAQCRGVWLDRGELDRIIDRSGGGYGRERGRDDYRGHHDDDHDHDDDRRHRDDHHDRDRHHDEDDEYRGGWYEQPRRKRGGAFTALTDLLGGGGD